MKITTKEEPKNRYSDSELREFKQLLLDKIKSAKDELGALKSSLQSDYGGNATITGDGPATNAEKESLNSLAGRQKKFITELKAALGRIQNKTYGICRETGKLIPVGRLRAVPHATLCKEAKENLAGAA